MTLFLRLLNERDKASALQSAISAVREGKTDARVFQVEPEDFRKVPGAPFAYWVSNRVRELFDQMPPFASEGREAQRALSTNDDYRYLRLWWEREKDFALNRPASGWLPFAKGGEYSPFYSDIHLLVNWIKEGIEIEADAIQKFPYLKGNASWVLHRECNYLRPGLTWPIKNRFSFKPRILPRGCIFAHVGPSAFVEDDNSIRLSALQGVMSSSAFTFLVRVMAGWNFEIGVIQRTPTPSLSIEDERKLATLTHRAWSLKRILDTVEETSHAFLLPAALRNRLGEYDPPAIEAELARIQVEIDAIAFELYGFDEADRAAVLGQAGNLEATSETAEADDEGEDDEPNTPADQQSALLSWCVGVAFGRFDIRLATGERAPPPEPEPFDPLPLRSPGMLPPETEPFHTYPGILVDDPGHPHDLTRLVEAIVERLDYPLPPELRRWLQRDFFPYHLQRYSKSRCQAPIYWPLTTLSGGYTLWLYYPRLTDQTLYTAINDFLEPKLKQVTERLTALRTLANRNRPQEKELEQLTDIELELKALRDELLRLAPVWKPNLNDGVQITAAPLWKRFRLPKWQKTLKETWQKLERGDYDWAHLAYHFWPERVREKCRHDKSLAIAHNLEALYEAPPEPANKKRGRQRRV